MELKTYQMIIAFIIFVSACSYIGSAAPSQRTVDNAVNFVNNNPGWSIAVYTSNTDSTYHRIYCTDGNTVINPNTGKTAKVNEAKYTKQILTVDQFKNYIGSQPNTQTQKNNKVSAKPAKSTQKYQKVNENINKKSEFSYGYSDHELQTCIDKLKNDGFWNGIIIIKSFYEIKIFNYHIYNSKDIEVMNHDGEVMYTTFDELNNYNAYFYHSNEIPSSIPSDFNSNVRYVQSFFK